jgi:hypothetical protein
MRPCCHDSIGAPVESATHRQHRIQVFTLIRITVFTCYRYYLMVITLPRVPGASGVLLESIAWVDLCDRN